MGNGPRRYAEFRFYREDGRGPFPRTVATALRAYRTDQAPLDPVVFRAGSTDSIYQQPLNVHLVLDLMSNAGEDHHVNQSVAAVLFESLGDPDREVADFAAQALARLEERYYQQIQDVEKRYRETDLTDLVPAVENGEALAELYLAFAELQRFNPMLRGYYLRKVLEIDHERCLDGCADSRLPEMRVRALIGLDRSAEAERELAATGLETTPTGLWLLAELSFTRQDLDSTRESIRRALTAHREDEIPITREQRLVAAYWGCTAEEAE
jgi:hypothetical protein